MRKKNSFYNIIVTIILYIIMTIFNFLTQGCIIKILGVEYSGINGLFTNVLTMLSVAELGIGTTIIFKLYKPIAENNTEEIKSWLKFYKKCYRFVAFFVAVVGTLLIPIIPTLVGKVTIKENIIILYLLALTDTILSYIMTYKRSLLYADQKNYIINLVHIGYTFFMNMTQITIIFIFKEYKYFLGIKLIYRILENIILNSIINKKYPYVKEKAKDISEKESKDVLDRVKAMILQKVSFVINKGIDNIVISLFLGINTVGYYSNYSLIVFAITAILYQITSSITASVGSLLTENNTQKSYKIYKNINMMNSLLTGICIVGFTCSVQPFIRLWLGTDYVLSIFIVLSFSIYIYSDSIRRTITIFKEAAGICKEDRHMYVFMALINLGASILLCHYIGVAGVILGTAISYIFLMVYSYPKYIYIPIFKKNYLEYFKENGKYFIYILISTIISYLATSLLVLENNVYQFLANAIISIMISIIMFFILFKNTEEFNYYCEIVKKTANRIINKKTY